jgi:phosphoserine phosphatase
MAPPSETAAAIVARLERELARCSGRAMVAFDGDGTLWSGDIGVEVFKALLATGGVREAARRELVAEADLYRVPSSGTPTEIARALTDAWERGDVPDERAYALHAWGFAGWKAPELDAFIDRVLSDGRIDERMYRPLAPVLAWAREAPVEIYVVSASPEVAVVRASRTLEIPAERILAMAPAWKDGEVQPALRAPPVYAEGKVLAVERAEPDAVLLGAFGDSGYDAPLLRRARAPVAVQPKPALVDAAPTIPGLSILAP